MKYYIKDSKIFIEIPASQGGKFRFKTRENNFDFGSSFATRSKTFNENVYLEWQIGYDATESDLKDGKKDTKLTNLSFTGYNGKFKHPYELSELVYLALEAGLISAELLAEIKEAIDGYKEYLGDKEIDVQKHDKLSLNGLTFQETSIRLPTFFFNNSDGTQIEVSIQKQQYATGVQPMLYFSIPIGIFTNGNELLGRSSLPEDNLVYVINKSNVEVLVSMLKIFGMASRAHNHDIREILKALLGSVKQL